MKNIFQTKSSTTKILVLFQSLLLVFFVSIAANAQDSDTSSVVQDNKLKIINKVPKHLPIKIEIIKGDSENILNDAEIKITNTGEKPIYYLKFFISTTKDFLSPRGDQYGFALKYGRGDLITFDELANETDINLKKGESYKFKVNPRESRIFDEHLRRNSNSAKPEKYLLEFQFLSFGDGTGFWNSGGTPFPSKKKQSSSSKIKFSDIFFNTPTSKENQISFFWNKL